MKKIVVLSGAGMSAESGILTFRDMGGLWQTHRIEEVASPEAWDKNRAMVLDFYNIRRKQLLDVEPNKGHKALVRLEEKYDVSIVTQNVDDLHERAGSEFVLHLHGELKKVRSEKNPDLIKELEGWELKEGDLAEDGAQLRPHIVWFGEAVPMIEEAIKMVKLADILIIVGTSLQVYPAAGLVGYTPDNCIIYYIDPKADEAGIPSVIAIPEKATTGLSKLVDQLLK